VLITLRHGPKAFVKKLDFRTSGGHMEGGDSRAKMRLPGKGPVAVISDLGILTPDPVTKELVLTSIHQGVTPEQVVAATGWRLKVSPGVNITPPPNSTELSTLRELYERTAQAHAGQA
jgi:glutaconate CoA-transferase subunit B